MPTLRPNTTQHVLSFHSKDPLCAAPTSYHGPPSLGMGQAQRRRRYVAAPCRDQHHLSRPTRALATDASHIAHHPPPQATTWGVHNLDVALLRLQSAPTASLALLWPHSGRDVPLPHLLRKGKHTARRRRWWYGQTGGRCRRCRRCRPSPTGLHGTCRNHRRLLARDTRWQRRALCESHDTYTTLLR